MKEKRERNHFSCDKLAVARDNGLQDIPVKSFQWDFACMDTDWIFRFCPAIWLLILALYALETRHCADIDCLR